MSQIVSARQLARLQGGWRDCKPLLNAPLLVLLLGGLAAGILGFYPDRSAQVLAQQQTRGMVFTTQQLVALAGSRWPALADIYWMQAVAVPDEALASEQGATRLFDLVDRTTALDPRFDSAYKAGAVLLSIRAGRAGLSDRILARGEAAFPNDWQYPFYLGFNSFFHRTDFLTAADYFEQAAEIPGAPAYLFGLASQFRNQENNVEVARNLLLRMKEAAVDPADRRRFEQRLQELR